MWKRSVGLFLLLWLWSCGLFSLNVKAAEAEVLFGSEAYTWTAGDVCPLGVYFNGNVPVESYSVCLEYDPDMLTYLNGADRIEGNLIWLEGTGEESSYKRMLHFQPVQEGETAVRITAASGLGKATEKDDSEGEQEEGEEEGGEETEETPAEEAFIIHRMGLAPIVIEPGKLSRARSMVMEAAGEMELLLAKLYADQPEKKQLPEPALEGSGPEERLDAEEPKESPEGSKPKEALPSQEPKPVSVERLREIPEPLLIVACILTGCIAAAYVLIRVMERRLLPAAEEEQNWKEDGLELINLERTVIDVRHVTMNFRLAQDEASSLKEYLIRAIKGQNRYRTFSALKDISFEVKQGDVLGIIGTNGSGKSTLLKIIAGVLSPSEGEVIADKSKVQMLTLGTGFDMELTARENVYLNGAIIGYSKEYIDEKYGDIVAFAELEGFMDERMKNFSSGMISRLGFAIATVRNTPDILILDEVLSVGDMFFRKKSEKRMKEMIHSGATVLIVSHSAEMIRRNCDKAAWIEKGVLRLFGKAEEVCRAYEKMEK